MDRIILYTQNGCKSSDAVKKFLFGENYKFVEKDITYDTLAKREMIERSGGKSVTPQIFLNNVHLKSIEELKSALANDKNKSKVA